MRIATYNIWNAATNRLRRLDALCEELGRIDADVVALQEVFTTPGAEEGRDAARFVSQRSLYPYVAFRQYPGDEDEGLAFLSKVPFLHAEAGWETMHGVMENCGLRVRVELDGITVAITNIHLDYKSIAIREAQAVAIDEWIISQSEPEFLEILCGDFNCYPESSVYRFFRGQQTISEKAGSVWHDLAASYAHRTGTVPPPTLDFQTNPRWANNPTLELPARFDWILVQERWPASMPRVKSVELIGRYPLPGSTIVPSDHYGVLADLEMT